MAASALILGALGNVRLLDGWATRHAYTLGAEQLTLTYPRVPQATEVPRSTVVSSFGPTEGPTIGWLLDGVRQGHIPPPRQADPTIIALAERDLREAARESSPVTRR